MAYILFECELFKHSLFFKGRELTRFREYWKEGYSVASIAAKLNRSQTEISLLVVDHIERGIIETRPSGGFGIDHREEPDK